MTINNDIQEHLSKMMNELLTCDSNLFTDETYLQTDNYVNFVILFNSHPQSNQSTM